MFMNLFLGQAIDSSVFSVLQEAHPLVRTVIFLKIQLSIAGRSFF